MRFIVAKLPIIVSVSLIDRVEQRVQPLDISVRAGWSSEVSRLTIDCHERASDYGYTHWVQPYRPNPDAPADWHVFKRESSTKRLFLRSFTSRDAAEMWVLHHAE